jgi:antitoxin Phd
MPSWQVQEAKSRFSELLERAQRQGPQVITKHGVERAVVLSVDDYRRLVQLKPSLKDYLLSGPKVDDFEIERSRDLGRETDL